MDNDHIEDVSSHPFFVRAEFPFVFIPTTSTAGFTFANSHTHGIDDDDQTTTQLLNEKEQTEEEEKEIIDDDVDHTEENDADRVELTQEQNSVRISQPKYSKLLKDLDFSQARMVDVTNLLSDEGGNYVTADETDTTKKYSGDEKYQSLTSDHSSISSNDEAIDPPTSSNIKTENLNLNNLNQSPEPPIPPDEYDNQINTKNDSQKKTSLDEDDDTSKQATQNYDLNDNEQEDIGASPRSNKNQRFTTQTSNSTQDDNLSSIPRLNLNSSNRRDNFEQTQEQSITWENLIHGSDGFMQAPTILIISQPIDEIHTTPVKEQQQPSQQQSSPREKSRHHTDSASKQKVYHRARQISTSSEADSGADYGLHRSKQKQHSTSQPQLSIDEDLHDLNQHLKQVLMDDERPYTTPSDVLIHRLSNDRTNSPRRKTHHYHHRSSTDTWLSTLEKLEREHRERLEKQQKQYEEYMRTLEENLKKRFDEYLTSTNSFQESKSENLNGSGNLPRSQSSLPIDANSSKYRNYQYRPLAKDYHPTIPEKRQTTGTNLSRSQSREDISNLRSELLAKHEKHISDLKSYYEHEIDELKNQMNTKSKMGHTSSTTRQSIETIERINKENIRLHDEIKDLRHTLKKIEEENHTVKRQVGDLRDQLHGKDVEFKNLHRTINELEQKLTETATVKERQEEKFRNADKQVIHYREENEKISGELNVTRERLLRLEERYRELENENKILRQQGHVHENNHHQRVTDDVKLNTAMSLNMPTSREYGRFTLTTAKYAAASSAVTSPRDGNLIDSGRYTSNGTNDIFHPNTSPRPLTRINDYVNERPTFPQTYVPPSRPLYSPKKASPPHHHHHIEIVTDLVDDKMKQSELLEEKFDELLKKRRDLESRINRIPTRHLTSTDRQLLDILEREIERVEQQISSVKLELRKMNILRTH